MVAVRTQRWCFTLNNWTEAEKGTLKDGCQGLQYLIFQTEVGENGTPHLQGYMEFTNKRSMLGIKQRSFKIARLHLEPARGTAEQCIAYCSKDDTFDEGERYSFGEPGRCDQGTRSDLAHCKELLDESPGRAGLKRVAEEHFGDLVRYHKGFAVYQQLRVAPRAVNTQLIIYWGVTGSGKSYKANDENPGAYWLMKPSSGTLNLDDYDGEDTVVMDEFYSWIKFDEFLRMVDATPLRLNTKGGSVQFVPRKLIITSNEDPYNWYPGIPRDSQVYPALRRRLDAATIVHFPFSYQDLNEFEQAQVAQIENDENDMIAANAILGLVADEQLSESDIGED